MSDPLNMESNKPIRTSQLYSMAQEAFLPAPCCNEETNFRVSMMEEIIPELPRRVEEKDNTRILISFLQDPAVIRTVVAIDDERQDARFDVDKFYRHLAEYHPELAKNYTVDSVQKTFPNIFANLVLAFIDDFNEKMGSGSIREGQFVSYTNWTVKGLGALIALGFHDPLDIWIRVVDDYIYVRAVRPRSSH